MYTITIHERKVVVYGDFLPNLLQSYQEVLAVKAQPVFNNIPLHVHMAMWLKFWDGLPNLLSEIWSYSHTHILWRNSGRPKREKQRKSNKHLYNETTPWPSFKKKKKQLNRPLSLHVIISALHIDFCGGIRSVNLFITWGAGTPRAFWISYHAISLRLHFRSLPSWNRQSTVRRTFGLVTCLLLSATTWLGLKVWCNTTRIVGFSTVNKSHKHDETQKEGSGWYTVTEKRIGI